MRYLPLLLLTISTYSFGEPIFKFHAESSWTYEVAGKNTYQVTNRVIDIRIVKNHKWYKLHEYGEVFWVRNSEKGQLEAINFFGIDPSSSDRPEEVLVFKYPVEIGETWDNYGVPTTYKGLHEITVPAGTFSCHMYFIDMENENYSKSCIAQNIGVVYNESVLNDDEKQVSKLLSFK